MHSLPYYQREKGLGMCVIAILRVKTLLMVVLNNSTLCGSFALEFNNPAIKNQLLIILTEKRWNDLQRLLMLHEDRKCMRS